MLVGVIDPSHKAGREDFGKPGVLPPWLTTADAIAAAEADPKWGPYTPELLTAMVEGYQNRGDMISVSALVAACPRAEVIKRKEDYVEELRDLYVPFRGTMVHRTLEQVAPRIGRESIAEARFFTAVDGVEFSCSPDLLTKDTLYDYKVTETPPVYDYPYVHHKEQVEFNAFVVRNSTHFQLPDGGKVDYRVDAAQALGSALSFDPREFPAQHVVLVYMGPKFPKVLEVERTEQVFNKKTGKFGKAKMPFVWPDALVLKVLRPRLEAFSHALQVYPEWPDGAENVWGGEPGWLCPGPPLCRLPNCLARRWPNRLVW